MFYSSLVNSAFLFAYHGHVPNTLLASYVEGPSVFSRPCFGPSPWGPLEYVPGVGRYSEKVLVGFYGT